MFFEFPSKPDKISQRIAREGQEGSDCDLAFKPAFPDKPHAPGACGLWHETSLPECSKELKVTRPERKMTLGMDQKNKLLN